MYIFFLNPTGYIVVPANKYLPPIIAYSFENSFGEICEENILLQILKADISCRIDQIDLIPETIIKNRDKQWQKYSNPIQINQRKLTPIIGPLLDTVWSQYTPYNNFCPIDFNSGDRSVAGCPAVAMAQILNYHRTTQNIQFNNDDDYYHNYGGNRYKIDDDYKKYVFPSFPELNYFLNTLQYNYENDIPLIDEDKAALNFACGVAAKQVYSPEGSGTFGVNQAYQAYHRFYFEDIELLTEGFDVYNRLKSNILEGFPAHIAVVDKSWNTGHNMVVDGYDDEGRFHINFGWGGTYNGWYMLPEELPLELTVLEGIIVDIYPIYQNGDLKGSGVLNWNKVKPNSTVTGSFIIQNNGSPESLIDWEIISWPDWGTWTFTPISGEDLALTDGEKTIEVSVTIPDEINKNLAGYVKIINNNDNSNYCIIHISVTTSKSIIFDNSILQFLKQYPFLLKLLKNFIHID